MLFPPRSGDVDGIKSFAVAGHEAIRRDDTMGMFEFDCKRERGRGEAFLCGENQMDVRCGQQLYIIL